MLIKNQFKLTAFSSVAYPIKVTKTVVVKKAKYLVFNKTHHAHKKAKARLAFSGFQTVSFNLPLLKTLPQTKALLTCCLLHLFKTRKDAVGIFSLQVFLLL